MSRWLSEVINRLCGDDGRFDGELGGWLWAEIDGDTLIVNFEPDRFEDGRLAGPPSAQEKYQIVPFE